MSTVRERSRTSLVDGDYSLSQVMDNLDPASIIPLGSRVLIRDEPEVAQTGSIVHPQMAPNKLGQGNTKRIGIVVAVGRGDSYSEVLIGDGKTTQRKVVRKSLGVCEGCIGTGRDPREYRNVLTGGWDANVCALCHGDGKHRMEMQVKVGDRVLYDYRREAQIFIGGEMFQLVDEHQSILGILED